jgi:cyclomaltodextrinase / maltogenic alpha-amylase / neopullulanase
MSVPTWVKDSVFYQIFPDRFCNGDSSNDPVNLLPWNARPTIYGFHGGDLRGAIDRMYYLLDLGINAIYLNPIFLSASNHRYNTVDYFQIDPKLGTKRDFDSLIDVAHRNQIRVVLDGVFNHCGRGFFAFNDILENQAYSPYMDWFHIKQFPLDAYSSGDATSYIGWWKYKSLPKFNTDNPRVRNYLFSVARYWLEQGIDGWRLDVPNEIDDDSFWDEFRQTVKKTNPEAYLLGEIWDGDPRWVGEHHFDGLMHYPMRTLILDLLNENINASAFMKASIEWLNRFPLENSYAMYTTLGSHDTERVFTLLNKSVEKTKFAYLFLFCYPGVPAIYCGDEIGLEGGRDPDCRRTFPWDESTWNIEIRQWIKSLIRIRKERNSLRRGDYQPLEVTGGNAFAFIREDSKDLTLVVGNSSSQKTRISINLTSTKFKDQKTVRNILGTELYNIDNGQLFLEINRWSGLILCPV